jgi:hypothetical protein
MKARLIILLASFLTWLSAPAPAQKVDGELITRTFKIDSAAMSDLSRPTPGPVIDASAPPILQQWLQIRFAAAGIEFHENPFVPTPLTEKAMFLNERTGELIVRATREDLQKIDRMVRAMQKSPPLVEIEVRFVEVPEPPIPFRPLPQGFTNTSVYTEKEFHEAMQRYEKARGIDIVTAPKVMTLSGRQARVGVEQPKPWIYQGFTKIRRNFPKTLHPTLIRRRATNGGCHIRPDLFQGKWSRFGLLPTNDTPARFRCRRDGDRSVRANRMMARSSRIISWPHL